MRKSKSGGGCQLLLVGGNTDIWIQIGVQEKVLVPTRPDT